MKFEFATTQRIIFGAGTLQQAPAVAKTMGRRGLLVTGQNLERSAPLVAHFQEAGTEFTRFQVPSEPTLDLIRQGVELAKRDRCDWVVACGGGSALDAGKAISALLTNPGDLLEYVEMIGKAKPLEKAAAPFLAIDSGPRETVLYQNRSFHSPLRVHDAPFGAFGVLQRRTWCSRGLRRVRFSIRNRPLG